MREFDSLSGQTLLIRLPEFCRLNLPECMFQKVCLQQNVSNRLMALHPCQPVIEALITVGKLFVIEPHQVQDGRVEVMDMDSIAITVDDVVSPFVGFAVAGAPAYTTSAIQMEKQRGW